MTSFKALTFLCLMWTSCALSAAESSAAIKPIQRGRIVIVGDSLTAGYGLDPAEAYPALLQKKIDEAGLPYEVVNAGVSGDTTAGGLRRIDWALRGGAEVLMIALGGNDGLRGTPPSQTQANLAAMVQRARAKLPNLPVIIAGMQMPGSMGRAFAEAYAGVFPKVATENRASLVPYLLEGVGGVARLNQPDLIHPTAEGQKRIAETVWATLREVLQDAAAAGGG